MWHTMSIHVPPHMPIKQTNKPNHAKAESSAHLVSHAAALARRRHEPPPRALSSPSVCRMCVTWDPVNGFQTLCPAPQAWRGVWGGGAEEAAQQAQYAAEWAAEAAQLVEKLLELEHLQHASLPAGMRSPQVLPLDPVLLGCLMHCRVQSQKAREAAAAWKKAKQQAMQQASSKRRKLGGGSGRPGGGSLGVRGIKTTKPADDDIGVCLPAPSSPVMALLAALEALVQRSTNSSGSLQLDDEQHEQLMREAQQVAEAGAACVQQDEPPPPWLQQVLWALGADVKFSSSQGSNPSWPVGKADSPTISSITVVALVPPAAEAHEAGSMEEEGRLSQHRPSVRAARYLPLDTQQLLSGLKQLKRGRTDSAADEDEEDEEEEEAEEAGGSSSPEAASEEEEAGEEGVVSGSFLEEEACEEDARDDAGGNGAVPAPQKTISVCASQLHRLRHCIIQHEEPDMAAQGCHDLPWQSFEQVFF